MAEWFSVQFEYGAGADAYKAVLTGKDESVLKQLKDHPEVQGKTGEALVTAVLAAFPEARFFDVLRYKNGKLNDGVNGEPAHQMFDLNGRLRFVAHCIGGVPRDAADGTPACQDFNKKGRLISATRFKEGQFPKELGFIGKRRAQKKFGGSSLG